MKIRIIFIFCLFFLTLHATNIETNQTTYDHDNGDSIIKVNFSEMEGSSTDWVGIYPKGASFEFKNVLDWKWTKGVKLGNLEFNILDAGNYDVRAFFNNSLTKQAECTFCVVGVKEALPDVNLTTNKSIYLNSEKITVSFKNMQGNKSDWIGVYPKGSSFEFKNVVVYKQTNGVINGDITFNNLSVGEYDIRAFFNNSLTKEASISITVLSDPNHHDVEVTTEKTTYLNTEAVKIDFQYMQGNESDWIGVYPTGSSYTFENVVKYKQTGGEVNGSLSFANLPVGDYDIRAFFNNTLKKEASTTIEVINDPNYHDVSLILNKKVYAQNELIYVKYDYMQGNATDWIGVYPAGASYEFKNVISWSYTSGCSKGELSLGGFPSSEDLIGFKAMYGLEAGEYEVRAFFKNSLSTVKMTSFTVTNQEVVSTMYEDANGSISPNWIHVSGRYPPVYYNGLVRFRAKWITNTTNTSEYTLPFDSVNRTDKVLELDIGGVGRWTPHFNVGVLVETTNGKRRMLWDSFLNHYDVKANKQGEVLSFPTYVELQRNNHRQRTHFRVNIDKYLKTVEPNNKLISVSAFFATGGDIDNIKLSSH